MKSFFKAMLITAAVGLSVFFCGNEAEAAGSGGLVAIEELKLTKVSDEQFENMKKGAAVSGRDAFIKEFQKNAMERKKTFSITCSSWNDVEENIYDYLDTIDDKKTSDDADFLKGSILSLGWSGVTNSSGDAVLNCKLTYTDSAAQVKKDSSQSKKLLKKLKTSKMSDTAKVKVIHDYVVKLVTYDDTLKDHSAYGGLVDSKHSTVCQGYALIMYKMLTDAGVTAHYVTGDAGGPHAWNIVKINGKWYYLDATWDDPGDTTVYDYFLKGSKTFNKDHKTDKYYSAKYKVASSDLNWKSAIKKSGKKQDAKVKTDQTKKEAKAAENAMARQEIIRAINDSLDEQLKEDPDATEYEAQMYDLCKKIYGFIIEDMSDKAFEAFLSDDKISDFYIEETLELINEYIINPMMEYVNSEDFADDVIANMYNDFGEDAFDDISQEDLQSLYDSYAYDSYTAVLYYLSEEYTEDIVSYMVKSIEAMV